MILKKMVNRIIIPSKQGQGARVNWKDKNGRWIGRSVFSLSGVEDNKVWRRQYLGACLIRFGKLNKTAPFRTSQREWLTPWNGFSLPGSISLTYCNSLCGSYRWWLGSHIRTNLSWTHPQVVLSSCK